MAEKEGTAAHGGLLQSIKHLGRTLLGAAQTRLEIFATEIEEERVRLEQLLLLALAAAFCASMALLLGAAFVVIYFWDTHRLLAVGLLAFVFLTISTLLAWILRSRLRARPKPFALTREELAKDRSMLRESRA